MKKPKVKRKLWRAEVVQNRIVMAKIEYTDPKTVLALAKGLALYHAAFKAFTGPVTVKGPWKIKPRVMRAGQESNRPLYPRLR